MDGWIRTQHLYITIVVYTTGVYFYDAGFNSSISRALHGININNNNIFLHVVFIHDGSHFQNDMLYVAVT